MHTIITPPETISAIKFRVVKNNKQKKHTHTCNYSNKVLQLNAITNCVCHHSMHNMLVSTIEIPFPKFGSHIYTFLVTTSQQTIYTLTPSVIHSMSGVEYGLHLLTEHMCCELNVADKIAIDKHIRGIGAGSLL